MPKCKAKAILAADAKMYEISSLFIYILASVVELAATSAFTYTFSKWPRIVFYLYFFYKKEKKCMTLSHIFLIQNPISENIPLILSEKYFKKTYIMGALKGLWNRRIKGLPIYPLRKIVINNLKVSS